MPLRRKNSVDTSSQTNKRERAAVYHTNQRSIFSYDFLFLPISSWILRGARFLIYEPLGGSNPVR